MGLAQVPAVSSASTLIQTITATSGTSVSFSSIPGTYTHLYMVGSIDTQAGGTLDITINGNGPGAIGYIHQTGSSTISGNTSGGLGTLGGSYPAAFHILFPDYSSSSSRVKNFTFTTGSITGSYWGGFGGGRTSTTTAITSLSITSPTISRAIISLYGWSA